MSNVGVGTGLFPVMLPNGGAAGGFNLSTGLVHYYKLGEAQATTREDSIGSVDLDVEANGPVASAAGKNGNGVVFDSTGGQVVRNDTTTIAELAALWTLGLWVKSTGEDAMNFLVNGNGLSIVLGGIVPNDISVTDGATSFALATDGTPFANDGSWQHLVIAFDGSQGTNAAKMQIYLDGVLAAFSMVIGDLPSSISVAAGAFGFGLWGPHDGMLDEIGVWNYAYTQTEVDALYNAGTGLFLA